MSNAGQNDALSALTGEFSIFYRNFVAVPRDPLSDVSKQAMVALLQAALNVPDISTRQSESEQLPPPAADVVTPEFTLEEPAFLKGPQFEAVVLGTLLERERACTRKEDLYYVFTKMGIKAPSKAAFVTRLARMHPYVTWSKNQKNAAVMITEIGRRHFQDLLDCKAESLMSPEDLDAIYPLILRWLPMAVAKPASTNVAQFRLRQSGGERE